MPIGLATPPADHGAAAAGPPDAIPARGRRPRRPGRLRRLHRLAGLVSGLGVLWLTVTGLPLFLDDSFGLGRQPAPAFVQHRLYGLAVVPPTEVSVAGHRITDDAATGWRFDGRPVPQPPGRLVTAVAVEPVEFLVGTGGVLIVDDSGAVVDRVDAVSIGLGRLVAGAVAGGSACVRDEAGAARCSRDGLGWAPPPATARLDWQGIDAPAAAMPITVERVLQDLHTLRFLGAAAQPVGVALALALGWLAVSGLWIALVRPARPGAASGARDGGASAARGGRKGRGPERPGRGR